MKRTKLEAHEMLKIIPFELYNNKGIGECCGAFCCFFILDLVVCFSIISDSKVSKKVFRIRSNIANTEEGAELYAD